MISRRGFAAGFGMALLVGAHSVRAGEEQASVEVIRSFYDTLLSVMKEGQSLGFAGRRDRLAPVIRQSFDFPQMTRLMV